MIKTRGGLIVPLGRRLNHAEFRAPVGIAVGAAGLIHIPNAAHPGRVRTGTGVIALSIQITLTAEDVPTIDEKPCQTPPGASESWLPFG
jgi:hypothetical protein